MFNDDYDFEAGAEDMERRAMRLEAEEEARREAAIDAEFNDPKNRRRYFYADLDAAKAALANGNEGDARYYCENALHEADGPGQAKLAIALHAAVIRRFGLDR